MAGNGIFSYETFVHALAGSTGSVFAMSVFYPLDIVKFRKQIREQEEEDHNQNTLETICKIFNNEGLSALYAGMKPNLISLGTSNFIYFYTFHGLKRALKTSPQNDLFIGIVAGIANVILTTPLWVVNSRLKIKKQVPYDGLIDGLIHIGQTEGLEGLWSGVSPSLMLVINPAIQFAVYEYFKRRISTKSTSTVFLIGAAAKAVATIATYPLQLAQTRQRYGKEGKMPIAALLLSILKKGGPKSLFQGLEAKLWQTILTAALMFVAYEKIFRFVVVLFLKTQRLKS